MPSRSCRRLKSRGIVLLLLLAGVCWGALWDWCGPRVGGRTTVSASGAARGPLHAGAARAEFVPPFPIAAAGYGPLRAGALQASSPLFARALVLQVDRLRVGIVSLDLLTPPSSLRDEILEVTKDLGLSELWLIATHTHSSMGSYEPELLFQVAGIGRYRSAARTVVVDAISGALRGAVRQLTPVSLEIGEGAFPELVESRSRDGSEADSRLTRAVFRSDARLVAEVLIFSAHPTLQPRGSRELSPDFPGHLSSAREAAGGGVVLLLQGAVGNARARLEPPEDDAPLRAELFAARLASAMDGLATAPVDTGELGFTRVRVSLPRPDSSRLVPAILRPLGDDLLCQAAPREAETSLLSLGRLRLLSIPGEITFEAGRRVEDAARATRVVSLVNGYIGYVETPDRARNAQGQSRLQYFDPTLLDALNRGAAEAGAPARRPPPAGSEPG